ncbi:MAG: hypothetical protein O3A36_02990 [bacterium]|nr:hypothetical protein [bacterium]
MKKTLLLFGLLAIAGISHIFSQYNVYSLFQIISSIPLFLVLLHPAPALLIACTFILFELYSSLPLGSMVLMFAIPYIVIFFWKKFRVELSWKFFLGVLLIIILQNIAVFCIVALRSPDAAFQVSWIITSIQIIVTSSITFIISFVYHEYSQRL